MAVMSALGLLLGIVAMVLSGALQANWRDVFQTVRRPVWLLRAILAVNVVVPAAALILCLMLPLDPLVEAAIVIMAVSPLAPPMKPKLIETGTNASEASAYFALLTMLSVLLVPVALMISSKALGTEVRIPLSEFVLAAVLLLLAPVVAGVTMGTYFKSFAQRLASFLTVAAILELALVSLPLLVRQVPLMKELVGDGTVLTMALISLAAVTAGHWLAGSAPRDQVVMATAAVIRNPGVAVLIIAKNSLEERAITALLLFLIVNLVVAVLYILWIQRRQVRGSGRFRGG